MEGIIAIGALLVYAAVGLIWQAAYQAGLRYGDPFRKYYDGLDKIYRDVLIEGQGFYSIGGDPCNSFAEFATERLKRKSFLPQRFYPHSNRYGGYPAQIKKYSMLSRQLSSWVFLNILCVNGAA